MASSGVNILRYSALGLGAFYGLYHQSSLTAKATQNKIEREHQHQSSLVQKAKAEYLKQTLPAGSKGAGGGVITDPDDSRFDLEAYLTMKAAEQP